RLFGFNSLFATQSIDAAKRYYAEFKRQQAERGGERLKIALIYSFAPNEDEPDGLLAEEQFELDGLDKSSREFLDGAIADYNAMFQTNFDTSSDRYQNYYKDLSERIRNREVDLTIVANMFLTGFDATTLNTLWVDKNLRLHGLLQAFSRTNRILNSVKTFGNIVCFRNLEEETNDAIALFGDKNAAGIVLLKPYAEYYEEYQQRVEELLQGYPLGQPMGGEQQQKDFVKLYGAILRLKNILTSFDDFAGNELLSERDFQDYQSVYLDIYRDLRGQNKADKEFINDDIVFEIELIKQVEINIDYILMLVKKFHDDHCRDKEILAKINRAILASLNLRSKKDLIEQFVASVTVDSQVDADWKRFVQTRREEELDAIIAAEKLNPAETRKFMANAFRDGMIQESGTAITAILPATSHFSADDSYAIKKQTVIDKLKAFLERFFDI
ncbi:MAG: type I restriction endonuclease subunit R, partial [Actinomycetia bacterium]|nr:type I restriction endonuclease subunit R [Actinomycetes bacterium]